MCKECKSPLGYEEALKEYLKLWELEYIKNIRFQEFKDKRNPVVLH